MRHRVLGVDRLGSQSGAHRQEPQNDLRRRERNRDPQANRDNSEQKLAHGSIRREG